MNIIHQLVVHICKQRQERKLNVQSANVERLEQTVVALAKENGDLCAKIASGGVPIPPHVVLDSDVLPVIELMFWEVGRVLTAEDVAILEMALKMADDDEELYCNEIQSVERGVLLTIGGEALVKAWELRDQHFVADATNKALAKFHAKLAEERAKAN